MASRPARLLLNTKTALITLLAITTLLQTGCSSVFFYPDNATYITPDRLNLEYEDIYLKTADGETL
ncbi:MAG: alpha/beta hydrolase, partial [Marinobacter sp.]|nr:alpha/beta hydrolase [Marinobacter sp.]